MGKKTDKIKCWKPRPKNNIDAPKNKGAMGLTKTLDSGINHDRMSAGARYTAARRRGYAIDVIEAAIEALQSQNKRLTYSSVARQAKMHRNTIATYYYDIVDREIERSRARAMSAAQDTTANTSTDQIAA